MLKTKTIDIQAIDHIVIRAHDLSRMVAFYRDVLGCEVERESDKFELVQLRAGNALIDLMGSVKPEEGGNAHPPLSEARNMDHFCVRIDPWDPDKIRTHLEKYGAEFGKVGERYGAFGRVPAMYLQDPEGNTVELMGPPGQ